MLIDTHLHLICEQYDDVALVISKAESENIKCLIVAGTTMEDNSLNLDLAKKYSNIFLSCGIHPSSVSSYDIVSLEKLIKNNLNKVVAIGEIGLDYHYGACYKNEQVLLFKLQLEIARKYNLPVVIHSRDATLDTLNILKEYNLRGVIHCFSVSLEIAKEYIKMGFLLGIGGVVTFKNSKLPGIVSQLSLRNIVLETDSPYLSPIRGNVNEPCNIKIVAECLANIFGVSYDKVCDITSENAISLFDLNDKL